ncbi:hypothetical protein CUJ83_03300 [Methanocella sp. CWC-04]|uniref:Uncharacterized protein n=1 Tax=Methanooceanicella nereidis TaxID=2052831 RepID=A0AAP2RCC9_9EURY|nr:hypothetical protein [Methanocella sp. CWC-04]MCD1294020.1 hypothetical protein [Methanocella sp. CWC-04]
MYAHRSIDSCYVVPVLPGKMEVLRRFWDEVNTQRAPEAEEHMRAAGLNRLLACAQCLPKGDFLAIYTETNRDLKEEMRNVMSMNTPYSRFLKDQYKDFSGTDFWREENTPKLEPLFDWKDMNPGLEDIGMIKKYAVFAIPILPWKSDNVRHYWEETKGPRFNETEEHLRDLDVVRLVANLQSLPEGDYLIQYIESADDAGTVMRDAASSDHPRSKYVREQYKDFSGIDLSDPRNDIIVDILINWDVKRGFETIQSQIAASE